MQKQSQDAQGKRDQRHPLPSWIRWTIICIVVIVIIAGTVIWIIQGNQAIIPVAVLTGLSILFGFIQLLPQLFHETKDKGASVGSHTSNIETTAPASSLSLAPPAIPSSLIEPPNISPQPVQATPSAAPPQSKMDRRDTPDIDRMYGRDKDLTTLKQWIVDDGCRVAAILGPGGIGKTSVAVKLMEEVKDTFTYVFWRSLQNAPRLKDILQDCIHFISNQKQTPETRDDQLTLLQEYLRTYRCLLILDNIESILKVGENAGQYREGYEDYSKLIEALGRTQHRSCLILTSREKPREVAHFEGRNSPVRSLLLAGLEKLDGQELLKDKDLFGSDESWTALIHLYSGNPLYLKVASEPIQEIFRGDIERFLNNGRSVFGDLRDPLDLQFTRLSAFEQEIVYWLAIEREAVSLEDLRSDIIRSVSAGTLLEGLNSLRRRSMIECIGVAHFTLQPMIMEYVLDRFIEHIVAEIIAGKSDFFTRFFLVKAQGKDYLRNSQVNLLLFPIIERLRTALGSKESEKRLRSLLATLRKTQVQKPSYAGGNILNLLIQLQCDVRGYDFSSLMIWQAYLQGAILPEISFAHANLATTVFTETFGSVLTLAFSPDSSLLVAGMANGDVRLWRFPSSIPHLAYQGHTDWVRSVAFSPDGKLLATGSGDQTIKVWNVSTGERLMVLQGHTNWVRSVVFSPNSALLMSGSEDQTVRVWDMNTGECLKILYGHADRVYAVACSPDGITAASGSHDRTIRLWNLNTGECSQVLTGHDGGIGCLTFRSDTELVSGSGDQTVRFWNVDTGKCTHILQGHTNWIWTLAVSTNGRLIASGSEDHTARIWDAHTGKCLKVLQGHQQAINAIVFNREGSVVVSGSEDQTVRLWDVNSGQCLNVLQGYSNPIWFIAFSPDGSTIAAGNNDQTVRLWDVSSRQCTKILRGHTQRVYAIDFSHDGRLVASGSEDCTVRLWDVDRQQCIKVLKGHTERIYSVSFSPDSSTLVSASHDQTIRMWNVSTGECIKQFHRNAYPMCCVAFSPKGIIVASGSYDKTVQVWNSVSGQCIHELKGHSSPVWSLAFSADGTLLASASHDHTVRIWDVNTGDCICCLQGHAGWVGSVTMRATGDLVASGSGDQTVRIWTVQTGESTQVLHGHTSWVWTVAFSPDGVTLASGSEDGTIRLWDVPSGKQIAILRNERPYERMNITGVTGLTDAQRASLRSLGAIELPEVKSS
jgi:WD40 repeat protein